MPLSLFPLLNVIENAFRRRNLATLLDKLLTRVTELQTAREEHAVLDWCDARSVSAETFATKIAPSLWSEASAFGEILAARASKILSSTHTAFGGGGVYRLLYFLARLHRPRTVIETGVAAGWSSAALLEALEANDDGGTLFSSDCPYFRQMNPMAEIGILVPERFRQDWRLHIDCDRINLPRILREIETVDLFHYDSDKSYRGRDFAYRLFKLKLAPDAVAIFDDIQDNAHFRDLVEETGALCHVIKASRRYVGILGI